MGRSNLQLARNGSAGGNNMQDFLTKRFALLLEPFGQENGELTPTLKVRRRVVEDHYRDLIEELYQSEVRQTGSIPILAPA